MTQKSFYAEWGADSNGISVKKEAAYFSGNRINAAFCISEAGPETACGFIRLKKGWQYQKDTERIQVLIKREILINNEKIREN